MNHHEIPMLDDDAREECRQAARAIIQRTLGDAPNPDQYQHDDSADYPAWVIRMIAAFMALAFIGAAMPSLFRLYSAGRDYFLAGIQDQWQAAIVGLSTFILSEFLVILSTVSATVLFRGRARLIFIVPVIMGLSMALVGNWTIVKPHDLFSLLEAVIPVFAVLFIAVVGERLTLHSIAQRHQAQRAYRAALATWQAQQADPEGHPRFLGLYANALKRAITRAYATGRAAPERRAALAALDSAQWRYLVQRELNAENWYHEEGQAAQHPSIPFGPTAITQADPDSTPPKPRSEEKPPIPFGSTVPASEPDGLAYTTAVANETERLAVVNGNGSVNGN